MSNMRKTAIKGREYNLDQMLSKHADAIAVGDMRMNARGDKLDNKNNVVMTAEQLAEQYSKANTNAVQRIPLSQLPNEYFMSIDQVKDEIAARSDIETASKKIIGKKSK